MVDIISICTKGVVLPKEVKDWVGTKTVTIEPTRPDGVPQEIKQRDLLTIGDPIETEHIITRTVVHLDASRAIRDEFQKAHEMLGPVVWRGNYC